MKFIKSVELISGGFLYLKNPISFNLELAKKQVDDLLNNRRIKNVEVCDERGNVLYFKENFKS